MGESEERARRIGSVITCISIYKKKKERYLRKLLGIYCLFVMLMVMYCYIFNEIRNFQIHLQEYDSNSVPETNPCDDGKSKNL